MNISKKIISKHLVSGEMVAGCEISIRIDQTLTQDSTGTMAYLQFEALGIPRVKTKRSVAYIDHNMLQSGPENADDHKYIQTIAKKHGIYYSKPGNGICHQVHLERFSVPGMTLLGSDSHTPTCGGVGMLAIGAGGLDVAVAMGGGAYFLVMPKIVNVELRGSLRKGVSSKDIILHLLKLLSVKGGVGKIMEYSGDGVATLSVPERATITNMGAELGATTSVFPSDSKTLEFLDAQGRRSDFVALSADENSEYDEHIVIDLNSVVPLAACPHSPDAVEPVSDLRNIHVDQVCIGSCTNSSFADLMTVARILKGRTVAPNTSLVISPGSRQVMSMLSANGALTDILNSGARVIECACGPCIGMGQAPASNAVSVRTYNRNFFGRSGTPSASVYLVSPETAAVTAVEGYLSDPRNIEFEKAEQPKSFAICDNLIMEPDADGSGVEVVRGPNIKPFPINCEMPADIKGEALLKMADNITTDHIMPSGAAQLPFRSNIPHLSQFCLAPVDPDFSERAKSKSGGILVAGNNYGQGSSREHAALVPLHLGIKAIVAKSFARIHMANLVNSGILPLVFIQPSDYDLVDVGDALEIVNAREQISSADIIKVKNTSKNCIIKCRVDITDRFKEILLAGGLLNFTKKESI